MTVTQAAIGAEWTKLWTTRTVWWALVAAVVLMLGGAGQYALYADNGDLPADLLRNGAVPAGTIAVLAVGIAQLAFVGLAMLVMTSEYSTGTIRATLTWIPSRGRLLLAKCTVVAAVPGNRRLPGAARRFRDRPGRGPARAGDHAGSHLHARRITAAASAVARSFRPQRDRGRSARRCGQPLPAR